MCCENKNSIRVYKSIVFRCHWSWIQTEYPLYRSDLSLFKTCLASLISLFKGIIIFYVCWENKNAIFVVFTNQSVQMSLSFCHPTTVHVTLFFDEFFVLFTNQSVQMSLSFCHHWSWIQTLKRPPYMIRGHVFFCQGRHPQGWWRYQAPGAHSLCCPRKTECCWNRDSVVPRRHFEGLKRPPRIRLEDSWNWLILIIPAMALL